MLEQPFALSSFYPLEDRVLLNGDAVMDIDPSAIDAATTIDLSTIELALLSTQALPKAIRPITRQAYVECNHQPSKPWIPGSKGDLAPHVTGSISPDSHSDSSDGAVRSSVAFVDASLTNLEQLLDSMKASYESSDSPLKLYCLITHTSGIQQ